MIGTVGLNERVSDMLEMFLSDLNLVATGSSVLIMIQQHACLVHYIHPTLVQSGLYTAVVQSLELDDYHLFLYYDWERIIYSTNFPPQSL